jgi:hypothetical protein
MLTVRLPIVASGNTIALYVWFDRSARLRPRRFTELDDSPPTLPAVLSSPCRKLDTPFKHASTGMSIFDVQLRRTGPIAHFVKTEQLQTADSAS